MTEPREGISLLGMLKAEGTYDAALITTYNAYLPFFEEVVLRRLMGRGCGHVVLAMDGRQLSHALSSPELRPRRAGSVYTLAPVTLTKTFHPKLLLLAGRKMGRVIVGSHNLTYAGYGHNRELTNVIRVEGARDRAGAAFFQEALGFVRAWTAFSPRPVREAIAAMEDFAPWSSGPIPLDAPERFVGALPDGPSLWDKVLPLIPDGVRRITVVGPFFDRELRFLRRLQADLSPAQLLVGVQPAEVELDSERVAGLQDVTFVDASALDGRGTDETERYLHAKALLIETRKGDLLITGSANPSAAAWLAPPGHRNAEAVVVRTGREARELGDALGLRALESGRRLGKADWRVRAADESGGPAPDPSTLPGALCLVETEQGFELEGAAPTRFETVELFDATGLSRGRFGLMPTPSPSLRIDDEHLRSSATWARLESPIGESVWAIVHHTRQLRELSIPSGQRQLRDALGTFETDPTQLANLLSLVEQVIFEQPSESGFKTGANGGGRPSGEEEEVLGEGSLGRSLTEVEAGRRARRACSQDLSVLLDALLRKLGEGLAAEMATSRPQRSDETLVDTEDETELDEELHSVDVHALADKCRKKTGRLFRRMTEQLTKADPSTGATRFVLQTTAVLGLIRALRRAELREPWWQQREQLVDADAEGQFFGSVTALLTCPTKHLLATARQEQGGPFDELSALRELMVWLAWDLELESDPRVTAPAHAPPSRDACFALALLTQWAEEVAGDERAVKALSEGLSRTPHRGREPAPWLAKLVEWGAFIARLRAQPTSAEPLDRPPRPGELARMSKLPGVFIVLAVREGKIELADFNEPSGVRRLRNDFIIGLRGLPRFRKVSA